MKITKTLALDFLFVSLNVIFFCSFNGLVGMIFGIPEFVSPLILLFCAAIVGIAGFHPRSFHKSPAFVYILFIFSYFGIGVLMRAYYMPVLEYDTKINALFRDMVTVLLVVIAYLQYFHQRLYVDGATDKVIKLFSYPLIATAFIIVAQPMLGITSFATGAKTGSRTLGVFANPNVAAVAANMALVVCIDLFFRYRSWWPVKLALIGLAIFACILPFSRTGIIVMVVTLVVSIGYFLFRSKVNGRRRSIQLFIIAGVPIMIGSYFISNYDQILEDNLDYAQRTRVRALEAILIRGEVNKKTTAERSDVFVIAADMIKRKPLLGYGLGMFNNLPDTIGVHNTYLLIIGNTGIIPFSLLILLLFFLIPYHIIHNREVGFLIAGFSSIAVLSFMTSHNSLDDKVLVLMLLFPVALAAFTNKNPQKKIS